MSVRAVINGLETYTCTQTQMTRSDRDRRLIENVLLPAEAFL